MNVSERHDVASTCSPSPENPGLIRWWFALWRDLWVSFQTCNSAYNNGEFCMLNGLYRVTMQINLPWWLSVWIHENCVRTWDLGLHPQAIFPLPWLCRSQNMRVQHAQLLSECVWVQVTRSQLHAWQRYLYANLCRSATSHWVVTFATQMYVNMCLHEDKLHSPCIAFMTCVNNSAWACECTCFMIALPLCLTFAVFMFYIDGTGVRAPHYSMCFCSKNHLMSDSYKHLSFHDNNTRANIHIPLQADCMLISIKYEAWVSVHMCGKRQEIWPEPALFPPLCCEKMQPTSRQHECQRTWHLTS